MRQLRPVPRPRVVLGALLLALAGSLVPLVAAQAAVINPASGGTAISADEVGTSNYTMLTGAAIAESFPGDLGLATTTILNVPSGFRFNPHSGNVVTGGNHCDLRGKLAVTTVQATFTVTRASTVIGCIATFVGLEVQPTGGAVLASGNITKTGTSAAAGGSTNYGTLIEVPGAARTLSFTIQPSATNYGGSPFTTQPRVRAYDQFNHYVTGVPVTLSILKGTGASGAHLACASYRVTTTDATGADYTDKHCSIDRASAKGYRLRATSGHLTANSGTFNINVGAATKLLFRGYPHATTKTTLNPQPRVAVTDAGGNTITTYPATAISIGISRNGGSFSCTGGTTATTVNGVATFHGCKQRTIGAKYRLTAAVGFSTTTGAAFRVVH